MSETSTIARTSRRKKETPEQRRKKRNIQIAIGIGIFIVILLLALTAQNANPRGAFIVLIGAALGYVLQRSRFCFTAALRDPILTGGTNLTKAVIVSLAISSIIFMALNIQKMGLGLENYGNAAFVGNVAKVGIHTAIGAFLFGVGAVVAGGCASGTLMRMGEGFLQQWIVIVFFISGTIIGSFLSKVLVFESTKPVFLPKAMGGWVPAFILQFGLFLVLFILVDLWGKRKAKV